jgi:uncharacterized protein YndB with AHSA1/START domain
MTGFQRDPDAIVWRVSLRASPEEVFDALDTTAGREGFWAEAAPERDGRIDFRFVNGIETTAEVLERRRPRLWRIRYFGSEVTFRLADDGSGGTDVTLTDRGVAPDDRMEVTAGWLNVLFPLKAHVDFGVDLRSHDPERTWERGYIDQ